MLFLQTLTFKNYAVILGYVVNKKYKVENVLSTDMRNMFNTSDAFYNLSQMLSISNLNLEC